MKLGKSIVLLFFALNLFAQPTVPIFKNLGCDELDCGIEPGEPCCDWQRNYLNDISQIGFRTDGAVSRSKPYSMHIYTGMRKGDTPLKVYQINSSEPGKRYKGSAYFHGRTKMSKWVRGTKAYISITFMDANGSVLQKYKSKEYTQPVQKWSQYTIPPTPPAPPGTEMIRFAIHLEKPAEEFGQSVINVDDCVLEEIAPCAPDDNCRIEIESSGNHNCNAYDFTAKITSRHPINPTKTKIIINEVTITEPGLLKQIDAESWEYSNRVAVRSGRNYLSMYIEDERGCPCKIVDEPIDCSPQPNVYLLSIGVDYPDRSLKYTSKDAKDFSEAIFRNYKSVRVIDTLWTKNNTRRIALDIARKNLLKVRETIRVNDILYVFIAGHGKVFTTPKDTMWCLMSSDVVASNAELYCFDITGLIDELRFFNCKKVVLVDACDSDVSDPFQVKVRPNFFVATATVFGEKSYECAAVQNGVFTEAILRLIDCVPGSSNSWLTAGQIKELLPGLVNKLSKQCNVGRQQPQIYFSKGADDMNVFFQKCN